MEMTKRTPPKPGTARDPVLVWLIEDNHAFRTSVARVLNSLPGLACSRAFASSEEALAELHHATPPRIVLLDVGLPRMNGIDAIAPLKELAPEAEVIMLTVFDEPEKIVRAICAGASGYMLKGAQPEKIAEAIEEVLQGGAPMNSRIARTVLEMFARLATPAKEDYGLTRREKEVLEMLVRGLTKKEIAVEATASYHTIDSHLRNIYHKLHVNSRSGAVAKALKENLFSPW